MAGKRRIPGQPPKPLKRHASAERRRGRLDIELALAATDTDRVHAAAGFVTAALAANPDPDVAASVVDYLVAAGDRLNKTRKANT
jgi:hypothetical protein